MAHGDHIHRENYGFISANGPTPTFAISHSPDLHLGNLSSVACGGHTPRTTLEGCIPKFTDPEGPVPSLVASRGQVSRSRNQRKTVHDELAQGMATIGHILQGNHAVNHTKGPAPASAPGHDPDLHLGNMGPAAYGGRTPRTTHGGYIPEFTYVGSPGPSLITGQGQDFHLGSQTAIAHGDLAQGMAYGGHICLGNHEIT